MKKTTIPIVVSLFGVIGLFFYFAPSQIFLLCGTVSAVAAIYLPVTYYLGKKKDSKLIKMSIPPFLLFIFFLPFLIGIFLVYTGSFSIVLVGLLVGLTITFFNNFLMVPLALNHKILELRDDFRIESYPSISIVVPAYNEEGNISRCIESLLEADYPEDKKEIIIVDDGSTDDTLKEAKEYEKENVKVVHKENGGKHSALNYGMMFAKGETIITADADSIVSIKAIKLMVEALEKNPKAKGIGGVVKVLNRDSILTKCQALDYMIGINLLRRAFDFFGSVPVVPGSLAVLDRDAIEKGGLFDPGITEDFDVTIKLSKIGEIIQAPTEAFVYTEAPTSWTGLYRQRLRWYKGTFESIYKHRNVFTNPKFGFLSKLTFPYLTLSMGITPFVGLAVIPITIIGLVSGYLSPIIAFFTFFTILNALLALLAIQLEEEDNNLIWNVPFLTTVYQQFLNLVKIRSLIDAILGREIEW